MSPTKNISPWSNLLPENYETPVLLAPDVKAVQMPILPAHNYLEDVMKLSQCRVSSHQQPAVDLWTNTQQMNLQLVDQLTRRAFLEEGISGLFLHLGDRFIGYPKLVSYDQDASCPTLFDALLNSCLEIN